MLPNKEKESFATHKSPMISITTSLFPSSFSIITTILKFLVSKLKLQSIPLSDKEKETFSLYNDSQIPNSQNF